MSEKGSSRKFKNNRFKKLNNIEITLNILFIILCIIFNIIIFIVVKDYDIRIWIVTFIFTIIILAIFYMQKIVFNRYMNDILTSLSDMLATISDMKEQEVFTMIDDSMFSKLQHQTLRLINILKSQNEKIEYEKNEIKSLIADIAHQLNTPLTNMKMYSEFLQDEDLSEEERREFNEVILLSLDKLCFLVESMIKMSRLESSVISLHKMSADINEAIIDAVT